ncbi:MAG: type I-E CRISPR-associated protein Cas6/Cse3/CasE [Gammaproteobacteria bacterium]
MNALHLVRMALFPPQLMAFARRQGLLRHEDEGHGYVLHAWLAAVFGTHAPKPFHWDDRRQQLLGYCGQPAQALLDHAQAFAQPQDWAVLEPDSLVGKPMPNAWRAGQRVQAEVRVCPVTRRDDGEKDVFLRAVDRLGDAVPPRGEVYAEWFRRQWGQAVTFDHLELLGHSRVRLLRRGRIGAEGGRAARPVQRPQATFSAVLTVHDGETFGHLLQRGIGRHRAFGYGMVLLRPAP